MKIAILGDTHFGARNDLKIFHDFFAKFYVDTFIPYLIENEIDIVIQLGDLFDRRKYVNYYTLSECKRYFFDQLEKNNITLHTLVGNHDIYWRESLEVNSSSLVLGEYNCVNVHTKPATISCDKTTFDIIPWICPENEAEIIEFIKNSKSDICVGHFEIAGFAMYHGMEAHDGIDRSIFEKFEQVWSGHYHTKSRKDNITYVGTPAEMIWQDYADPKGFHTFDLDTRKLEFIPNPNTIFARIEYDDSLGNMVDLDTLNLKDCYVKLIVVKKTDYYKFDKFMNKLYNKGCYEIKIIEDLSEFSDGEVGEEINLEDTVSVLSNYIDSVETDMDKEKVKTFMRTLYTEAINSTEV